MKLIPEAKRAWRLWSIRISAFSTAVMVSWPMIPEDLRASMPGANYIAAGLLGLTVFSRLVDQGLQDKDV